MAGPDSRRPSEWRRVFRIAIDLIDQLRENAGGDDFEWSFGAGTAMIQIGHRESHDIDIFLDDPQLLGFIDPSRSHLHFETMPTGYLGDGLRFQKFALGGIGAIDYPCRWRSQSCRPSGAHSSPARPSNASISASTIAWPSACAVSAIWASFPSRAAVASSEP